MRDNSDFQLERFRNNFGLTCLSAFHPLTSSFAKLGIASLASLVNTTSSRGRTLSHDFLRLPSKRQYPDYYVQIKRPIALDDIKRQLDSGQYAFFDEVKQDFEQCFKNAKKYNMKESQIWKDAKYLHVRAQMLVHGGLPRPFI